MNRSIAPQDDSSTYDDITIESLGGHLFFGDVDTTSVRNAIEFIIKANRLFRGNDPLTLYVNTSGGTITDGLGLIDIMQISRHPIKTFGIGTVMSMGVYILSAGAKGHRSISRQTTVMAHQYWGESSGKFHELMSTTRSWQYCEQQTIRHFLHHSTMNEKQIRDILFSPSDRYLTPAECKKYGLIDKIVDEMPEDEALASFFTLASGPAHSLAAESASQPHRRIPNTASKKKR